MWLFGAGPANALRLPDDTASIRLGIVAYRAGDPQSAWLYWNGPAHRGHIDAQFLLGHLYRTGPGIPRDPQQATDWFRKAADQGHGQARLNLALMFDRGIGDRMDRARAYFYAVGAAETLEGMPHSEARQIAMDIAKRMTPDEVDRASRYLMSTSR